MKKVILLAVFSLFIAFQSCKEGKSGMAKVISPQEVYEAVYSSEGNHQLVDVRTEKEFEASHLKDAQNICVTTDDFKEKVKTLDKNEPVYVYCKKGRRSARAGKILTEMGFTKVYDLQGGILNWEKEGLETSNQRDWLIFATSEGFGRLFDNMEKLAENMNASFKICAGIMNRNKVKEEQLVIRVDLELDGIIEIVTK